jgi:acetyl-CoA carboxylase biotin carboxyl carrier protein
MPLNEDDVREILRLIDESDVAELRIETAELSLHVLRGEHPVAEVEPPPAVETPPPAAERGVAAQRAFEAGDLLTISAPMLGVFYRAPSPGAPPFADVGTQVESGTVVCLIEVMKMMNPVHAGVSGTIVQVCAENAELVEHGEALFRVRPE